MIARLRHVPLLAAAFVAIGGVACQRVPLLAPSGSTITLTASTNAVPVNGSVQLVAQLLEPAGTPPHSGTHVIFTTTLGTIEPSEVETDVSGRAVATFKAGAANGTATITASSGGASASGNNAVKVAVGTAAVGRVTVSASPTLVPAQGGTSTITAVVIDINGNVLPGAPVSFSTTAGTLDTAFASTDQNGLATVKLTTSNTATVTASVGAQAPATAPPTTTNPPAGGTPTSSGQASGSVIINIAAAPQVVITPPTTAPTAGLPSTFTFAVTVPTTNGSAVRDVTVDWGDGFIQDLGAVTGSAVIAHTYHAPGAYTITATVTDASGNTVIVRSAVIVNAASLPLTITAPATPPGVGLPATFTIAVGTLPAGDVVRNVHLDWGDGQAQDLGAISGNTTVSHVYTTAGSFIVTATLTDTGGNSSTTSTAVTVVATASPTIIITPSVPTGSKTATFQIQVTPPTGVGVQDALLNFGDGAQSDLGGLTGTTTVQHTYPNVPNQTYTVTLTVTDTLGRKTTGSTTVNVP